MARTLLRLDGELTIASAAAQREALLAALPAEAADATLALDAVEAIDSAGVQLLVALRRTLAERGGSLALAGAPECVGDALARYGIAELFASGEGEPSPGSAPFGLSLSKPGTEPAEGPSTRGLRQAQSAAQGERTTDGRSPT